MRFKQFINERSTSAKFDLEKFLKDIEFYLKQTKGYDRLMFHGDKNYPSPFAIKDFKEREKSRDSRNDLHTGLNDVFETKFGWPFRNGLFTAGDANEAGTYGPVTVIFPIGRFEWLGNTKIDDITKLNWDMFDHLTGIDDKSERTLLAVRDTIKFVEKSEDWLHNKRLGTLLELGNEVMVKCDKYYQFDKYSDLFIDVIEPSLKDL